MPAMIISWAIINRCKSIVVRGDKLSPVLHLSLAEPNTNQDDEEVLNEVAKYCLEQGVAVVTAKYLTDEMTTPPSRYIRITRGIPV